MIKLGVIITAACVTILVAEFLRHRKGRLPLNGWLALVALCAAEFAMFRKVAPIATYFTPIAWTCYIVLADAALRALRSTGELDAEAKKTLLWHGRTLWEKCLIALLSVPLWLIFELYNLRLANWMYVGVPENFLARYFGYAWSFATITPGIFATADLFQSFGWFSRAPERKLKLRTLDWMTLAGGLLLVLPVVLPKEVGAYLFALVWLGFVLLLDPINCRLRLPSLLGDWVTGRRARLYSLLLSGWVCGWLWEFWNYWAAAKWLYIFPMFQEWKIFEMPIPGFFGFLPFALECFAMYVTATWLLGRVLPVAIPADMRR